MPNTDPAAATGLPKEPENLSAGRTCDRLARIRSLVECGFLAAAGLGDPEETDAFQALLDHVSRELKKLSKEVGSGNVNPINTDDDEEGDAND
jgi:hypothetical protein